MQTTTVFKGGGVIFPGGKIENEKKKKKMKTANGRKRKMHQNEVYSLKSHLVGLYNIY